MTTNPPRLEISSTELALWLDGQDPDVWWLVDGDPLLTGKLSFPCPGDLLAAELRRISPPLLLIPPDNIVAEDRTITRVDLNDLAQIQEGCDERIFCFRWLQFAHRDDWILIEDKKSAILARGLEESLEN